MIDINLATELTEQECVAELSCILAQGKEHRKRYTCKRLTADSSQRAELKALITGLKAIQKPSRVTIWLHASHLTAAIRNDWLVLWRKNGWKNQKGKLVRDWELWKEVMEIVEQKQLILVGGEKREVL